MNKKAHSNYLKLFLVFLVIFGVIGSVLAEKYYIYGKPVDGEAFASLTGSQYNNGKEVILIKAQTSDGTLNTYLLYPEKSLEDLVSFAGTRTAEQAVQEIMREAKDNSYNRENRETKITFFNDKGTTISSYDKIAWGEQSTTNIKGIIDGSKDPVSITSISTTTNTRSYTPPTGPDTIVTKPEELAALKLLGLLKLNDAESLTFNKNKLDEETKKLLEDVSKECKSDTNSCLLIYYQKICSNNDCKFSVLCEGNSCSLTDSKGKTETGFTLDHDLPLIYLIFTQINEGTNSQIFELNLASLTPELQNKIRTSDVEQLSSLTEKIRLEEEKSNLEINLNSIFLENKNSYSIEEIKLIQEYWIKDNCDINGKNCETPCIGKLNGGVCEPDGINGPKTTLTITNYKEKLDSDGSDYIGLFGSDGEKNKIKAFQEEWIDENCNNGKNCNTPCIGKLNGGVCEPDGINGPKTQAAIIKEETEYNLRLELLKISLSPNPDTSKIESILPTLTGPEKTAFLISYDEKTKKFYTQTTNNKIETPLLEIIKQNPNYVYNLDEKAKAELEKVLNIYDEKSLYQLKSTDITLYQALSTYTNNPNIKSKFENIENFQAGKITDATEAKKLLDAGWPLTISAYNTLANEYKTISSQINELETKIAASTTSQTEKDSAKKELEILKKNNVALTEISKRGLNDMDFISSCLKETTCTLDSLANSFETKPASWKGLWLDGISKQTQLEQAIIKSYDNYKVKLNNELSTCSKNSAKTQTQCMDEYNSNLETKTEELVASLAINGFSDESFKNKLRQNIKKDKIVETNIGYDILTTILSPDQNAMSAAKLFGVEADYSNVPKFLSESIPSQICLAKIDGYLDKTKESSINGQGGLTSYGCSQEYTQVYDEETKKYKKMPQTQCLEVLADLRAQRTQMTPDGKTAISYSYYIKAPPSTELKYIVAISYIEGSTIKKQTIVPLTKTSGIKNGFDSVELFLNASENGEINENSFTINLLAIYENNEVYQKLSYSIPPITTGDSYSTPIPAQIANSNGANSGSNSNQNVKAELSTEDMLAMI